MVPSASRKLLPVLAFIFFGVISFGLWQSLGRQEDKLILHHVEHAAEQARIRIKGIMNAHTSALELLADRWVDRTPHDFSQARFFAFAETVFDHFQGFTAILWLNTDGSVQWAFPEKIGATAKEKWVSDRFNPGYKAALEEARNRDAPSVGACAEIYEGKNGFMAIVPLIYEGRLLGYLSGVFQVPRIVDIALPKSILEDFAISIYDGQQVVFESKAQIDPVSEDKRIRRVCTVDVVDRTWRLSIEPGKAIYSPRAFRNLPFLGFGIFLSAALSCVFYLLLLRIEQYKESRDLALHEVSERKRVEEALREKEKRLKSLLSELSTKNAELESFVYTISHDLKTPIVTIEGSVGALREDFEGVLPRDAERFLDYMSNAAKKMELLINDLLELSRIGRLVANKTTVPFEDLINDALGILQPQIDARGISIDIGKNLPALYGEKKRLGQVIYNLLNNAIKYIGKDNPAPRIEIGISADKGRSAFYVRDNGIGIDSKYFDKIFHIFERLPSAKHEDGTGIGLTIVKRIIEYHGGRIWLTSELGKGTTFFFTINETNERQV